MITMACFENHRELDYSWWRHPMEAFSASLAFLCGEYTDHRWIPRTSLWSAPGQTTKQTFETQVIWETIVVIMTSL